MISLEQIVVWARAGESWTLELKRTTNERREAVRTLCAMLNNRGGQVLFGVEADGRVTGQQVSDHTIEEIAQEIKELDPPAFPTIDRVDVGGEREVLVVSVGVGHNGPYSYRGQAYRRVGNTSTAMSRDEYNRMLLERLHGERRWENQPAEGWDASRLDHREMVLTLEESIRRGRLDDPGTREPQEILRGLGLLIGDSRVSRAAVVLFCKDEEPLPDFPQLLLKVARFKGVDRDEFVDNRQFQGNAFALMRRAERFLIESLPVAGRIVPGRMEREDTPLLPVEALREALANAFVHRDYAIGGGSVNVALFDDRLEIISIGDLHFGLTPEALFREHESRPWNPMIARTFYRRGIIETWGRGTLKIARLMREAGHQPPTVSLRPGAVVVTFKLPKANAPENAGKTTGKTTGKTPKAVLQLLSDEPALSVPQLAGRLKKSELTIHRAIRTLRESGRLVRVGPDKGGYWKVIE